MIKKALSLGLLLFALPLLAACGMLGSLAGFVAAPNEVAEKCKAWETPRAYIDCLAGDLAAVVKDFTESSKAGQVRADDFLAAQPYWNEARAALNDAGRLLDMAQVGRDQAVLADSQAKKVALDTAAATAESTAIIRAAVAEDRIRWVTQALSRARAPPQPSLTAPLSLLPTPG